jgi:hypothetical protein
MGAVEHEAMSEQEESWKTAVREVERQRERVAGLERALSAMTAERDKAEAAILECGVAAGQFVQENARLRAVIERALTRGLIEDHNPDVTLSTVLAILEEKA